MKGWPDGKRKGVLGTGGRGRGGQDGQLWAGAGDGLIESPAVKRTVLS